MKKQFCLLVTLLLTFSLTLPFVTPAKAQALKKLRVGYLVYVQYFPAWFGAEKGWFKEVGLDVELTYFQTGPPLIAAMEAGTLDIGWLGTTPLIFAVHRGVPIKPVAMFGDWIGGLQIFVPNDSPIQKFEDLKGKTIIYHMATTADFWLRQMLTVHGMTADDVNLIHMAPAEALPGYLKAVETGEVDAFLAWPPQSRLLDMDPDHRWIVYGHDLNDFPGFENFASPENIAVTQELIDRDPGLIYKYLSVVSRCWDYYHANEEEVFNDICRHLDSIGFGVATEVARGDFFGLTKKHIASVSMNMDMMAPKDDFTKSALYDLYMMESEFWKSIGSITTDVITPDKYYDTTFMFMVAEKSTAAEQRAAAAESAIAEAKTEGVDVSDAEAKLSEAKDAIGARDYDGAIGLADEAESLAKAALEEQRAAQQQEQLLLYGGIVIVVIVVAAAAFVLYRRRST